MTQFSQHETFMSGIRRWIGFAIKWNIFLGMFYARTLLTFDILKKRHFQTPLWEIFRSNLWKLLTLIECRVKLEFPFK